MAYRLGQHRVSEAVTVKVYIADGAVKFYAKHTGLGMRKSRKELAEYLIEHGPNYDFLYSTDYETRVIEEVELDLDQMEQLENEPGFVAYEGNDTNWYSKRMQ